MDVRPLTSLPEFTKCMDLQREAFGAPDIDLMPARFMIVVGHIGGAVLGAYDGDKLVAFLTAMPGIRNGRPYWHSQMLAVARTYWDSGIGTRLKLAQRDYAISRGIHLIEWTFDPLESKNAYLNIAKLGAIVRRYYVNHYGSSDAAIFQGLDTDRVVAEWWLNEPHTAIDGEQRRVAIPADLQRLKQEDLQQAREVQRQVRSEFLKNIQDDFCAVGLARNNEVSEYIFVKDASRVHQAD